MPPYLNTSELYKLALGKQATAQSTANTAGTYLDQAYASSGQGRQNWINSAQDWRNQTLSALNSANRDVTSAETAGHNMMGISESLAASVDPEERQMRAMLASRGLLGAGKGASLTAGLSGMEAQRRNQAMTRGTEAITDYGAAAASNAADTASRQAAIRNAQDIAASAKAAGVGALQMPSSEGAFYQGVGSGVGMIAPSYLQQFAAYLNSPKPQYGPAI